MVHFLGWLAPWALGTVVGTLLLGSPMTISQQLREWCLPCTAALSLSVPACRTDDAIGTGPLQPSAADSSTVLELATWNSIALRTTAAGPFSPPRESRAMAMLSIAVFDAVNSITGRYEPFAVRVVAEPEASTAAAVTGAAYRLLLTLYPATADSLEAAWDSARARLPAGHARDAGFAAGDAAAAAVLAMRAGDGATPPVRYSPGADLGDWVPTPPGFAAALEPAWGEVRPFALDSGAQFRPPPPPLPGSVKYVQDYLEIVTLGAKDSLVRGPVRTEAARFWQATAAQLWNQVVRQLTIRQAMDPTDAARAYLFLNVAGADAMIAAWDAKFSYGQWRPVTAIRSGADDGSPATLHDTTWTPLLPTPPFPDYPAGHTSYGGAAEVVLEAAFGADPGDLAITSPTAGGVTHHYGHFSEIAEEVLNARVWAGVHWRGSSVAGRELGRAVGAHLLSRAPKRRNGLQ